MRVFLVPVGKGRPIAVDKAVVFIGRHPESDVVLTRSRKVSRKHCCLAQVNNRLVIRDLGSTNGVRVNGKRVQREAPVQIGDEVAIGDVTYRVQLEAPPTKPANGNAAPAAKPASQPAAVPAPSPRRQPNPENLSQEIPVVVPDDDGESFAVEATHLPLPPAAGRRTTPLVDVADDEDDIVLLEEDDD
jgi:predicted component of type VI protein secretion system